MLKPGSLGDCIAAASSPCARNSRAAAVRSAGIVASRLFTRFDKLPL
jgi:hypothetical protein